VGNDKFNASHCADFTAYRAIENVEEEKRVNRLIGHLLYIINLAGYQLEGRITLVNKKTGKTWR
jgi:hypothetical protein